MGAAPPRRNRVAQPTGNIPCSHSESTDASAVSPSLPTVCASLWVQLGNLLSTLRHYAGSLCVPSASAPARVPSSRKPSCPAPWGPSQSRSCYLPHGGVGGAGFQGPLLDHSEPQIFICHTELRIPTGWDGHEDGKESVSATHELGRVAEVTQRHQTHHGRAFHCSAHSTTWAK